MLVIELQISHIAMDEGGKIWNLLRIANLRA
jgi:hypothetical protein